MERKRPILFFFFFFFKLQAGEENKAGRGETERRRLYNVEKVAFFSSYRNSKKKENRTKQISKKIFLNFEFFYFLVQKGLFFASEQHTLF